MDRFIVGKWNLIAASQDEMEALDEEIKQDRLAYYDTPQKKLEYLAEILHNAHYKQYGGTLPRLDRTAFRAE